MSSLRSDSRKTTEKRTSPRVGVGARGTILVHTTRQILNVFIRDLSIGGIGLTCDHPIPAGTHFSLLLNNSNCKPTHQLYEVRHCRSAVDDIYDVGARLVSQPATSTVEPPTKPAEAPIAEPAHASPVPQR